MVPTVLIFHTLQWPNAARMAIALNAARCRVCALCQSTHPLNRLSVLQNRYRYNPLRPLRSLRAALRSCAPDLVVPCDDWAVRLLHQLYRKGEHRPLVERSLGRPDGYVLIGERGALAEIARKAAALIPRSTTVSSPADIEAWLEREGTPAVLKSAHSSNGAGVAILQSSEEAKSAFARMAGLPMRLARSAKRLWRDGDSERVFDLLRSAPVELVLQSFIPGAAANCAVACWQGEVIAGICVEAVLTRGTTGPAVVVRVIECPDMIEAARRVVRAFGVSGFCGFDFVLEAGSGRPYLIEINPRATQVSHLSLGNGRDLAAALRARIADEPLLESPAVTDRDEIALFPQAWQSDLARGFLATAYHDLPQGEPRYVRATIGSSADIAGQQHQTEAEQQHA